MWSTTIKVRSHIVLAKTKKITKITRLLHRDTVLIRMNNTITCQRQWKASHLQAGFFLTSVEIQLELEK